MLRDILLRIRQFENVAHTVLARDETSPSRVIQLSKTYEKLKGLSLKQDELFRQALRCVEKELFRAAHVMAWAGFMDFLEGKLSSRKLKILHKHYPDWAKFSTMEDLRENVSEYHLIEAARKAGLCTKNGMKALHGLLNKRNECAHPSDFYPELNDSLGYISELFQRIAQLANRKMR